VEAVKCKKLKDEIATKGDSLSTNNTNTSRSPDIPLEAAHKSWKTLTMGESLPNFRSPPHLISLLSPA